MNESDQGGSRIRRQRDLYEKHTVGTSVVHQNNPGSQLRTNLVMPECQQARLPVMVAEGTPRDMNASRCRGKSVGTHGPGLTTVSVPYLDSAFH